MPLTLVTGPANAAKAGEVLGGLRARLEDEPILVVPGFADVDHAQRELAERGAVFGASVLRFEWLYREIARRAGHSARVASDIQRELIVEGAVRRAELGVLAESAGPARLRARRRALRCRAGPLDGRAGAPHARAARLGRRRPRRAYAEEVAAIYRGYRDGLESAGLADAELFAWRALDALRREPAALGRHAGVRLRLRRLRSAAARRARDARPPLRGRRDGLAAVRARSHRVPRHRERVSGAAA